MRLREVLSINTTKIAKLANVSRSTVSRVINGTGNVDPKSKERVLKIIDKYGYKPNQFARGLVGKTANIIGIYMADINSTNSPSELIGANSPYNMELLKKLIETFKKQGFSTMVDIITDPADFDDMHEHLQSRLLYGAVFVGFPYLTKELENIANGGYNVVLIDQLLPEDDYDNNAKLVNSDNYLGGYLATKYLQENGHKDIAFIAGDYRLSSIEREKGYLKAMSERSDSNITIVHGMYREDIAYSEIKKLLKKNIAPSAFFAANDIMALGASKAIIEKKLRIPQDISIIGFDNIDITNTFGFNTTTFEVSFKQIAENTANLLLNAVSEKHIFCAPKLIEKTSVKKIV